MKIQGRELRKEYNYLDKVTYVPNHAKGNAGHPDCEQGVIIDFNEEFVNVLYSKSRNISATMPENLVWG